MPLMVLTVAEVEGAAQQKLEPVISSCNDATDLLIDLCTTGDDSGMQHRCWQM